MSKYTVRHYTNNNSSLRVRNAEFTNIMDAKEEMKRYVSDDNGSCSKLYSECGDVLAYRDWNKKRIAWI